MTAAPPHAPPAIALLGPQRFRPTVAAMMASLGVERRVAIVTAGWQEREDDDTELSEHLGGRIVNLKLHSRGEDVFRADRELAAAWRARQERLRQLQDFYRVRLEYTLEAARAISRKAADPVLLADARQSSIEAIRFLDAHHVARCQEALAELEARYRLDERDAVARHRRELAVLVAGCDAIALAGGHVAVLLNRLKLFDFATLAQSRPVVAWSAGAMALAETVVLFHDSPPQGPAVAEILETGIGLCPDVVPLPHAQRRLKLDDRERVETFARRFAPAVCLVMGPGAQIVYDGTRWGAALEISRLGVTGDVEPLTDGWRPHERGSASRR